MAYLYQMLLRQVDWVGNPFPVNTLSCGHIIYNKVIYHKKHCTKEYVIRKPYPELLK